MESSPYPTLTKQYYSIGEVAGMFGVAPSVIRYWEVEFSAIRPTKNSRGERKFTPRDIVVIADIHYLLKEKGYTIDGARKELQQRKAMVKEEKDALQRLKGLRQRLYNIWQSLDDMSNQS